MKASEAQSIAYERLSQSDQIEIDRIEDEIPRRAKHGMLNTFCEYAVGNGVVEHFKSKGYKVIYFIGNNGSIWTSVSWADPYLNINYIP